MKPLHGALAAAFALFATPALALDCDAGMRAFNHAAGETCIPENPQRIVSLHRLTTTLTLMDLGATDRIVSSEGVDFPDDAYFVDLVAGTLGIDYAETGITPHGWEPDLELLASLAPDLIIARPWDEEIYDQLSAIAPMVSLPVEVTFLDYLGIIADAGGVRESYEQELAAYNARIEVLKSRIPDASDIEVAIFWAEDGELEVYDNFYALTQVLDDVGFSRTPALSEVLSGFDGAYDHATSVPLSLEAFEVLDADIVFAAYWYPYTNDMSGKDFMRANLDDMVPGWCDFLAVCQARQIVYLDAAETYAGSFASLHAAIDLIEEHIANRDIVQVVQ